VLCKLTVSLHGWCQLSNCVYCFINAQPHEPFLSGLERYFFKLGNLGNLGNRQSDGLISLPLYLRIFVDDGLLNRPSNRAFRRQIIELQNIIGLLKREFGCDDRDRQFVLIMRFRDHAYDDGGLRVNPAGDNLLTNVYLIQNQVTSIGYVRDDACCACG
jgi:hypothetical protein